LLGADWIATTYEALSAAARDIPCDQSELDRNFETYRASEQGFRTAFEDFHRLNRLWRLVPISMVKLVLEANSLVRRQDPTWA
jgi:hypothetical protein